MSKQMKAPKGTRDILPGESERWERLQETAFDLFRRYGYRRIVTPTFESTGVFQRAIGEESEIVQKQMYSFEDKKGRSMTLRPEGTASVVRAFIEHNLGSGPLPVKLYYAGQMFRYERPQKGRQREFWQLGVEVLGSDDPVLDAEQILMLIELYQALGLTDLVTHINSMGCPECRPAYVELLKEYLRGVSGLCHDCQARTETNPLRIFDCKQEGCHHALEAAPKISDHLDAECQRRFSVVKDLIGAAGIETVHDEMLVRGFDYYQRTIFEVRSGRLGAQNALGGGGRYDGLVAEYGGPPTAGIGFAVGCERILIALGEEFQGTQAGLDAYLVTIDESVRKDAYLIAKDLRGHGLSADLDFGGRSVKSQMKAAHRAGARAVIVIGPDELTAGEVRVKVMATGAEENLRVDGLAAGVSKLIR